MLPLTNLKNLLLENYSKYFDDLLSGERSLPFGLLVYSKTGVFQGHTLFFLIFALKHRLWVLVRPAPMWRFKRVHVPTIYVLSNNKKNITIFHLKMTIFTAVKNRSIFQGVLS